MKNATLTSRIKKAGFEIEIETPRTHAEGVTPSNLHRAVSGDAVVTWYEQGASAVCLHCGRISQPGDSMTDYFPGYFPRTIKGAIEHLRKG